MLVAQLVKKPSTFHQGTQKLWHLVYKRLHICSKRILLHVLYYNYLNLFNIILLVRF
jgi:hypothetical protein